MIPRGNGFLIFWACVTWGTIVTAESPPPIDINEEFLEFLGGWELDDGTWVDPLDFLETQERHENSDTMIKQPHQRTFDQSDHDQSTPTRIPNHDLEP